MNFLLSRVYAQVDGVASPTIPFTAPGNVTPTTVGPTTSVAGPSISLNSDVTNLNVGEKAKVQIVIDTQLQPINQYSIQILFNPEHLRIMDFDPATPTIEIDFRDTFFNTIINEVSQQQGIITLSAENPVGSASITDRVVAEFEIEALSPGFAELTFNEQNTMLLDASSIDILQSTNTVEFVIGGTGENVTPVVSEQPGTTVSPTSSIPLPSRTPDTALPDNMRAPAALIFGVVLIAAGSYLYRLRGTNAHKES